MSIFFLATEACWCETSKKCYAFWFILLFKFNFLRNFMFQLLHQDPNWIFMKLSQINRLKSGPFRLLHQNLDCTKVRKLILMMTCFSNLIFCAATGLVSPINVLIASPIVVVEDSIEEFFYFDSCIAILMSGNALMVFSFESRRSSKKIFSVSTGLNSSIKVSIEKKILELTFSFKKCRLSSCYKILMVQNFQKVQCIMISLGIQNSFSSENFRLICCMKTPIEFYGVVTNQSIKK